MPCLWETFPEPPTASGRTPAPHTADAADGADTEFGNFGWLFGAGGDFSGIPVRVRPRVRVPTLGDAPDGGPQLGGVLTQYTASVAEHRVDVLSEHDSAAPSSLAWCRDAQAFATYGT